MKGLDDEVTARVGEGDTKSSATVSKYELPYGYISNSQIGMYLRCPRQYEFRYIQGQVRSPGIAMALGSAVHKAIEDIHQATIDEATPLTVEAALDSYADKWEDLVDEFSLNIEKPDEQNTAEDLALNSKDVGTRIVRGYHEHVAPNIRPLAVEKQVELDFDGIHLMGYIDLIEKGQAPHEKEACTCKTTDERKGCAKSLLCNLERDTRVVVDNKVVKRKKSQRDVDNSLQLSGYALMENITNVRYDCLVKPKAGKTPVVHQIGATRTNQELQWYKEIVKGVADGISRGYFPPCPPDSWVCSPKFCGYWSQCRGKKV